MKYSILFLVFIMILPCEGWSQTNPETLSIAEEVYCKNKNYIFELAGRIYQDNDKAYICENNLPADVTVCSSMDTLPVSSQVIWTKNGVNARTGTATISIDSADLVSGQVELQCQLADGSVASLKVTSDLRVKFSESASKYQFDDNKIQAYIDSYGGTEKLGTPWNFIEAGQNDILQAKASKKKGYYAVSNIIASSPNLVATPTSLSGPKEDVVFDYNGTGQEIIEVYGCQTDPELLVYTADRKEIFIEFFELCDSDDDIQVVAVGDTVSSATDVCIDGGNDLTIDEMRNDEFRKGDDELYKNDSTGRYYVLAGLNKVCETKAHEAGPLECPGNYNANSLVETTNNIFNKIGIGVIGVFKPRIVLNYNLFDEDGILDGEEHFHVYSNRLVNDELNDGYVEVYWVNDLGTASTGGGDVQGRGPRGTNTIALDVEQASNYTLVHELGHAKWSLKHPGGPGTGQFQIDDLDNFMHGISNEVRNWNIRRYQIGLIQK